MKRYLTLLFLLWSTFLNSQTFQFAGSNPFNIQLTDFMDSNKVALKYDFVDVDGDGDLDLNLMGLGESDTTSVSEIYNLRYFIDYQENIGTRNLPLYKAREKRFTSFNFPKGKGFMIPSSGDINGDGHIDFIVSSEVDIYNSQYLQFQINDGNGGFITTNCLDWGLDAFPSFSFFIPKLTDLDNDGDLDILMGGYRRDYDENNEPIDIPVYMYAKNIGTPTLPEFLGWFENPYGLVPLSSQYFFTSGDIDMDGDMDVLSFDINEDNMTIISFIENIAGPGQKPLFTTPVISPFGLPVAGADVNFLFPDLADIDTDGDLDLFFLYIENEIVEVRYYRNNACMPDSEIIEVSLCPGEVYHYENQTYSVAGNYYIQKVNSEGCISVVQLIIDVKPNVQISIQLNGNILSTPVVPGYTFKWLDCTTGLFFNTATNQNFTVPYTGSFAVEVTELNGCKHQSDCVNVIVTGTEDVAQEFQIGISPNPCNGILHFWNNPVKQVNKIQIYSMDGICIYNDRPDEKQIDLSGFSNGLYLIRFDFGQFAVIKHVVIQK